MASSSDIPYATNITQEMESSAKARGTGIAKRSPEYVAKKMEEGKAVIAVLPDGTWVGFCYIEAWGHNSFVANSGTGLAVMKINSDLGYEPVTYSELTDDEEFWAGCKSCVNYDILVSKERKNCMCTAMLYDPKDHCEPEETSKEFSSNSKLWERFMKIKQSRKLSIFRKKDPNQPITGNPIKTVGLFFMKLLSN